MRQRPDTSLIALMSRRKPVKRKWILRLRWRRTLRSLKQMFRSPVSCRVERGSRGSQLSSWSAMTEEVVRQISVQVVQQIDVPVPQSFVQKEEVPQGMTQEVLVLVAVLQVQIVDVPVVDVPVMMQQQMPMLQKVPRTVEIPQAPQERISACIVERAIDVPVRQNLGETTTVVKLAPHERVQQRTVEQIATNRIAVAPVVMQRQRPAIRQSQKLRSHMCRSRSRAGGKGGNWKVDRDRSAFPCRIRITLELVR